MTIAQQRRAKSFYGFKIDEDSEIGTSSNAT